MTAIYSLRHPQTGRVHYVGKTVRPLVERVKDHIKRAASERTKHTRTSRWIAKLLKQGLRPVISLIEVVPKGESWEAAEGREQMNRARAAANAARKAAYLARSTSA